MSPKLIAILVIVLIIIFGGMALTMKRAADKRRDRTAFVTMGTDAQKTRDGPGSRGNDGSRFTDRDPGPSRVSLGETAALQARVDALEREVAALRETVERLSSELGVSR